MPRAKCPKPVLAVIQHLANQYLDRPADLPHTCLQPIVREDNLTRLSSATSLVFFREELPLARPARGRYRMCSKHGLAQKSSEQVYLAAIL